MPQSLFSFAFPDAADRGITDDWTTEDASEEDRNCNGRLMTDLASPYRPMRTVTITGGGAGCLAAPAVDHLKTYDLVTVRNIEPFRATIHPGQTEVELPGVPVDWRCVTEADVPVPSDCVGNKVILPGSPIVKIVVEWWEDVGMAFISLRKSRDKDAATVSFTLVAKEIGDEDDDG